MAPRVRLDDDSPGLSGSDVADRRDLPTRSSNASSRSRIILARLLTPIVDDPALIATALVLEFGSLQAALSGSRVRQLRAVNGNHVVVRHFRAIRVAMLHVLRRQAMSGPLLANWQSVFNYLRVDMGYDTTERFRILYLNSRNLLLRDETLWRGTIDNAQVHVREVIARAIELGAAAMILVHNHPSGISTASQRDIALTRQIADAGARLGIRVHDHIIVSVEGCESMRERGFI